MLNVGASRIRLLAIGILLALVVAAAPEAEDAWGRLRSMPVARRIDLRDELAAFRGLPAEERARIRALDATLRQAEPGVRERYFEVLRLYELWLGSLEPEARQRLLSAPPSERMGLVRELIRQGAGHDASVDRLLARSWNPSGPSILDQSYEIRSWYALSAAEKAELASRSWDERREFLERRGRENQVPDDRPRLLQRFEPALHDRLQGLPGPLRQEFEAMEPPARAAASRRILEALVLQEFDPEPVAPTDLDRFARTLPGWMLSWLDPLPPGAAEGRLRLLYRLAFRPPEEVPTGLDEASPDSTSTVEAPQPPPAPPTPPIPATPF